jgi:Na+-transporting NADH:ubiquinone oxidoreductase subunit NqrC
MNTSKKVWVIFVLVAIILIVGFLTSVVITKKIDRSQRAQLLVDAKQAALLVPTATISTLSASSSDIGNPLYAEMKERLMMFRAYNPENRFVYVLGYKPEIKKQFFYVDSEPVTSSDYSAPGALFPDTREQDIENYLKGEAYTDGPYKDSWGEWVSGYAPIKDSNGEMVALLGIDTATSVWHQQIVFVRSVIALISILLSVVVGFVVWLLRRKQSSIETLTKENQTLYHQENKLKEIQDLAHIGKISVYFPDETFVFEGSVSRTLNISEGERLTKEALEAFIKDSDKNKIIDFLNSIKNSGNTYEWLDVALGTKEQGYRNFHIYGNVLRDEILAPKKFSGIIQDITDIKR